MANDIIVIEYQANIKNLENNLKKVEDDLRDIEKAGNDAFGKVEDQADNAAKGVDNLNKSIKNEITSVNTLKKQLDVLSKTRDQSNDPKKIQIYNKHIKETSDQISKLQKNTGSLRDALSNLSSRLPFAGAIQEVKELGSSLGNVTNAVGGSTKAFQFLRVSMLAVPIVAIVAALGSLIAFFKSSESGGDKLAKIFNVLKAIGSELLNVFISIGRVIVDFTEKAIEEFSRLSDVIVNQVFESISGIAEILKTLGFNDAAKAVDKFNTNLQQTRKDSANALKEIIKLGEEIADLQDKIGAETIDIALANSELTTQIEVQLKALRNRTNTYEENLAIIDKIGTLEQEKLKNNMQLINDQIALKRKEFIRDSELKNIAGKQFDAFIAKQISAQELLNQVTGSVTEDTLKGISEILLARDEADRQSLLLQQKLTNMKDMELEKEKARLEKERQAKEQADAKKLKEHEDYLKKLDDMEKMFREMQEKEFADTLKNLKDFYTEQLNLKKEQLLNGEITEKQFADESDELLLDSLDKQKTAYLDYGKDVTDIEGQILDQKIKMKQKETEEEKKNLEKRKALLKQFAEESLSIAQNALNSANDLQLARQTQEIESERSAFDIRQQNLLKSLEDRKNAGLISEEQFNKEKAKLDLQKAQKESELKKKQFIAEKNANINKIRIETAVAIIKTFTSYEGFTPPALVAVGALLAAAALQTAAIRNTPVPKFKDGVIRLNGPGTETSDSIPAMLSKNESVIKAKQSIKHTDALRAIQNDYFDKFIYENHVIPAMRNAEKNERGLRLRQANTADNIMKALEINGFGDMSHLERLTKSNKKVIVQNLDSLPKEIGKEMSRIISNNNYMK